MFPIYKIIRLLNNFQGCQSQTLEHYLRSRQLKPESKKKSKPEENNKASLNSFSKIKANPNLYN